MSEQDDSKMIITADEASSLLPEGDTIHTYRNPNYDIFIGCDWERSDIIKYFAKAEFIEISGPNCKRMKHPIAVWDGGPRPLFVQADMPKVLSLELAKVSRQSPT